MSPTRCVLLMADGGPVGCKGTTFLPLCIGGKVYHQQVLIADIEAPFVVGYNFLYDKQCSLDISKGQLLFPDQTIDCKLESEMPRVFKIALSETVEIPANSEVITSGIFSENTPHFSTAIIDEYTNKLAEKGIFVYKLRKTFSKFYRRYFDLISKFQVGLKSLLRQGLSEPDFYGDLVYKLKKIVGSSNFSAQFIKIISHYKKIGYNINVLKQTACLVVNPITVGNFAFLFNCTLVGRTSDSMMVPT